MTAFFVRTDRSVAGPFTGVELREAALAGIIRHDAVISGAAEGPWYRASDIGLFSDKNIALPHPPDTSVPLYQVRGMHGAFQGPFKLRELIGFAARGMLPADALLQSNRSSDWIPARRIRILSACLNGDLVLIDDSGNVILRSTAAANPRDGADVQATRAPIEVAKSVSTNDRTAIASSISRDEAEFGERLSIQQESVDHASDKSPSVFAQVWERIRIREWFPWDLRFLIRPRLAIQLVCLVLVFAGVASAFSFWKQIGLRRDQIIGDWTGMANSDQNELPTFGLSLRADGRCVMFNTQGPSWTGDFVWAQRSDDQNGFEQMAPFSTVFDQVAPQHQAGNIMPTDGYIRLKGFVKEPPIIDGRSVRDLFLRRDGDTLRIGYLASVHWTQQTKRMEAGWMTATAWRTSRADLATELRSLAKDLRVPTDQFGGATPMHLSEAIDAVHQGIPSTAGSSEAMLHECLAYSSTVSTGYLLANYGLPDEARRIYRFEIPQLRGGPSFDGSQVVRYGELKFIFSAEGQLRYLMLVPNLGRQARSASE
jgi:hypothetical protein